MVSARLAAMVLCCAAAIGMTEYFKTDAAGNSLASKEDQQMVMKAFGEACAGDPPATSCLARFCPLLNSNRFIKGAPDVVDFNSEMQCKL